MSAARMVLQGISQRRSEKCVEIDKKIERYRSILRSIRDEATVDGAEKLIAMLEVIAKTDQLILDASRRGSSRGV
jgi:hypothetical protein